MLSIIDGNWQVAQPHDLLFPSWVCRRGCVGRLGLRHNCTRTVKKNSNSNWSKFLNQKPIRYLRFCQLCLRRLSTKKIPYLSVWPGLQADLGCGAASAQSWMWLTTRPAHTCHWPGVLVLRCSFRIAAIRAQRSIFRLKRRSADKTALAMLGSTDPVSKAAYNKVSERASGGSNLPPHRKKRVDADPFVKFVSEQVG